jgi:hypothetical protein
VAPYWSSDNRVFFVSNRGGTEAIWSARTDARTAMTAGLSGTDTNSAVADVKE